MGKIRPIAIYLPQFHPIPENNAVWGDGFTEWTNVVKARPLYKHHYKPQLPADLGFYDLRLEETRIAQAELARKYGIYGFAYYHYWFNGKRLLNTPLDAVLKSNIPDFPICLFWANETWSRRWLGEEKNIIIKQTYSEEDDYNHIHWLIKIFSDSRYIKVGRRPVFIIYRPTHIPDIHNTIKIFRSECIKAGIENPYLIASNSHSGSVGLNKFGFDGILNFEPQLGALPYYKNDGKSIRKFFNNLKYGIINCKLKIYNYEFAHKKMMDIKYKYKYFPCTFVNWDNTPRRSENGIIIQNSSPEKFRYFLEKNIEKLNSMDFGPDENFIFINAWNEWAEGNYLEPDVKNGLSYLEAVKKAITKF